RGSGVDEWRAYAAHVLDTPESDLADMERGDVIALVEQHEREQQPRQERPTPKTSKGAGDFSGRPRWRVPEGNGGYRVETRCERVAVSVYAGQPWTLEHRASVGGVLIHAASGATHATI